ncbi:hypothetical protein MGSAQ_003196 [marine sediment metagenome]|uniref:Uncharacterized protein n=1 Tax=marine sediment metagenome TaxID=412755 RepID=A0A1B6NPH3_9ZZZZ
MAAIILANAGLVTVLLINEGATQGELLQSSKGLPWAVSSPQQTAELALHKAIMPRFASRVLPSLLR